MSFIESFIIIGLGLWRVVSLLANETGPFDLFLDIRIRVMRLEERFETLQDFHLYEGYTCEWCLGFWLAMPAVLLWYNLRDEFVYVMLIPALSSVVIIVKYIVQTLQQVEQYMQDKNIKGSKR